MPGVNELMQALQGGQPQDMSMGGMPQGMPSQDIQAMAQPQGMGMGQSEVPFPTMEQIMMILQMLKNMGMLVPPQQAQQIAQGGMPNEGIGSPLPQSRGMTGGI